MKESEIHPLPAFLLLLLSTCFGFNSNALVVISVNGFVGDMNGKLKFIYKIGKLYHPCRYFGATHTLWPIKSIFKQDHM